MKVITTTEASRMWNVTPRRVAMLASQGRIQGAKCVDNRWLIPSDSQKPSDIRKKSEKSLELGHYVFPNIVYVICKDYSVNDLCPEEKCLYDAFMCYECGEFKKSATIAEKLLKSTKSLYIRIGALYILGFLYIILKRFDEAYSCIIRCQDACTKAEDHKHEISLFMHELEMYYRNKEWITNEFRIEPSVESSNKYSDFQLAYCNYLSIVHGCAELSYNGREISMNSYELSLAYLEKGGYDYLALQSHFYISIMYAARGDEKGEHIHLKRAVDIAIKNKTYNALIGLACWIPDALYSVLEDYPKELKIKFDKLIKLNASSYADFEASIGGVRLLSNLTSEDYMLISYCLRKYTAKSIAEKLGISYSKARNQLKDLYGKLNVKGRAELISVYTSAINNSNVIK